MKSIFEKSVYNVQDIIDVEYNLEPVQCLHCGAIGEVTYYQYIGDAHCAICGKWQLDEQS